MLTRYTAALGITSVLLLSMAGPAPGAEPHAKGTRPRDAALAFYDAILNGHPEAVAKSVYAPTDEQRQAVQASEELASAIAELRAAVTKQLGAPAADRLHPLPLSPELPGAFARAEEDTKGDKSIVTAAGFTVPVIRIKDQWLVDLPAQLQRSRQSPGQSSAFARGMAAAIKELTGDVSAGRFKDLATLEQVLSEIEPRPVGPAASQPVRQGEPVAVLKAAMVALATGEVALVPQLWLATSKDEEAELAGMTDYARAAAGMKKAAAAAFGAPLAAKLNADVFPPAAFDNLKATVDSNRATVGIAGQPALFHLERVNGAWRVKVLMGVPGAWTKRAAQIKQIGADIADGKLKTYDQALEALGH